MEHIAIKLLVSLLLGAAIGLERESGVEHGSHNVAGGGVRTFALVGLMGALAGIFYVQNLPLVFAFISAGFMFMVGAFYVMGSSSTKDFGLTTEISFLLTFLIGVATVSGILPLQVVVAVAVVLILVLSLKGRSRAFASKVSNFELQSFISYAILALVVLPFLPNVGYTLADVPFLQSLLDGMNINSARFETLELINPRRLWFIVVLVTGIDVLGYILSKFVGSKRGFTLTSFVGGFVSSTSTTQSLAQRSKKTGVADYLVGAALLANMASFFQIVLLVGPLNSRWLVFIIPTLLIIIAASGIAAYYFLHKEHEEEKSSDQEQKKIFSLVPALKFAVLLIVVKLVTGLCLILFGQSGFLISSVIASFAGLDAILVNLATLAGGTITFQFALLTFVLVNATNLLSKAFFSFLQGSRPFAAKFLASALVIILASGLGLVIF